MKLAVIRCHIVEHHIIQNVAGIRLIYMHAFLFFTIIRREICELRFNCALAVYQLVVSSLFTIYSQPRIQRPAAGHRMEL
jgi:hypothetical protein